MDLAERITLGFRENEVDWQFEERSGGGLPRWPQINIVN
jgi:hypothetical protein